MSDIMQHWCHIDNMLIFIEFIPRRRLNHSSNAIYFSFFWNICPERRYF
jgi:hypothetical protein